MRRALLPFLLLVLSACAPQRQPPGVERVIPSLTSSHAITADGYRLPFSAWRPDDAPRAVVLALHGFNDYRRAFETVGPHLARRGFATYAFDQRGFGETDWRGIWPGQQRMATDVGELVGLLRQAHPGRPVYLLGESMGAAVSVAAVADAGIDVDGAVLVAPAVWSRLTMPWYQRLGLWLAVRIAPGWTPTGESLGRVPSDNREMLRAMWQDPLVIKATRIDTVDGLTELMDQALAAAPRLRLPSLILYGERDQIVPRRPVCRFLQTLPAEGAWRVALYPEGYHMLTRDLQATRVLEDIAGWLADRNAALPSGLEADRARWRAALCPD